MQQLSVAVADPQGPGAPVGGGDSAAPGDAPAETGPAVDEIGESAGGEPGPAANDQGPGMLIYVQGYHPDRRQVLSMCNTGDQDGLLRSAIAELRSGGWLDGGDQPLVGGDAVVRQRQAIAAALIVAVAVFESAAASELVSLDGVDKLLGALLDREPVPSADQWDVSGDRL